MAAVLGRSLAVVPGGYLISVLLVAVCTAAAVTSRRRRTRRANSWAYMLGFLINELPGLALLFLAVDSGVAVAQGDVDNPVGVISFGLAMVTSIALIVIIRRSMSAADVVSRALGDPGAVRRRPVVRTLLQPLPVRPRAVERITDLSYGPAGTRNLLDVYVSRRRPAGAPVLVYFHGGSYRSGHKHREGRPLLHHLAARGWVCVSANYRLSPQVVFPDHLVDAKRVLAWVATHVGEYGGDPDSVFVAGSSAGGHLAAMAALTANQPALQPGFEHVDTSVAGLIAIYAYYGRIDTDAGGVTSPLELPASAAPPCFVAHGDRDSLVGVDQARRFADGVRRSGGLAVYAELPGAQHGFDVARSIRSLAVVDAIDVFTQGVRSGGISVVESVRPTRI
jgi:acetyl esterase/lipase